MTLVVRRVDDARQTRTAYVVGCVRSGEAMVVDPPRDVDACIEVAARDGLRIAAVAETRVHGDFLSGARELAERTGALVLVSGSGGSAWTPRWVNRYAHRLLRDGDTHDIGGIRICAVHVPGYCTEQLMYLVYDHAGGAQVPIGAFTGDFLSPEYQRQGEHASNSAAAARAAREVAEVYRRSMKRFLSLPEWMQAWPMRPVRTGGLPGAFIPQTTVGCERRFGRLGPLVEDLDALTQALAEPCRDGIHDAVRMRATNIEGVPILARMPRPLVLRHLEERTDLLDPAIATIVDTRAWTVFRSGHLRGAIHAPVGRHFSATVAAYIEPDERVVLVCDPEHADELVRECIRVGVDRIEAIVPPALLHLHRSHLQATPEIGASAASLALAADDVQLIDVRDGADCARGMIVGSLRVHPSRLSQRAEALRGRKVIAYCSLGSQSATVVSVLRRMGIDAVNLAGGFEGWKRAGLPTVAPGGFETDPACHLGLAPAARTVAV